MDERGSILGPEGGLSVDEDTIIYVIPFDADETVFHADKNEQQVELLT